MINSNNINRYLQIGGGKSQIFNHLIGFCTKKCNIEFIIKTKTLRLLVRDASIAAFLCFGLMFSSCGNSLPFPSEQPSSQEEGARGTEGASQDSIDNPDIDSWGNGDSGDLIITPTTDGGWEDPDNVNFDFGA